MASWRARSVYVIVWKFQVKPGLEAEFEEAYGPDGKWAQLFRQAPGYVETELLKSDNDSGRFLTVDRWISRRAHEDFLSAHAEEYARLLQECERLLVDKKQVGDFVEPIDDNTRR